MSDWNTQVIEELRKQRRTRRRTVRRCADAAADRTGTQVRSAADQPDDVPRRRLPSACLRLQGGAPTNPDWYENLVANPQVTVEVGTETYSARAAVLEGEERDRLYAEQARRYPGFAEYQAKTERIIPVVALVRD